MSLTLSPHPALSPDRLRDAIRRSLPLGVAITVHVAMLALLLRTPPADLVWIKGVTEVLDVRFYTVSATDAESDARLIEPPLAEVEVESAPAAPAPVNEADTAPAEPAAEDEAALSAEDAASTPAEPQLDQSAEAASDTAGAPVLREGARAPANGPAPSANAPAANGAVATTQLTPPPPRAAPRPPRFADILARAETRLDPDDFRVALSVGGVREAVRESFCLSSSAANLEAGDCPDGPNAASAELARFGLQGPGEEPPEFLVDLDRMEFQLRQLGANPSQVERIMLALRESRREAINTPGVRRAMQRDREARTDNLGNPVSDPFAPD